MGPSASCEPPATSCRSLRVRFVCCWQLLGPHASSTANCLCTRLSVRRQFASRHRQNCEGVQCVSHSDTSCLLLPAAANHHVRKTPWVQACGMWKTRIPLQSHVQHGGFLSCRLLEDMSVVNMSLGTRMTTRRGKVGGLRPQVFNSLHASSTNPSQGS